MSDLLTLTRFAPLRRTVEARRGPGQGRPGAPDHGRPGSTSMVGTRTPTPRSVVFPPYIL
ncbi:hypothetical protein GCM10010524_20850 [Streptomyces mexicanus]